jgi:hypothetical protein
MPKEGLRSLSRPTRYVKPDSKANNTKFKYGQHSMTQVATLHPDLQKVFYRVLGYHDHKVLEGSRDEQTQNRDYADGSSHLQWPNSKHNVLPSNAVDVLPFKGGKEIDWDDLFSWYYFAGIVLGIAFELNIPLIWGGDWNSNHSFKDQNFNDLGHFERVL